MSALVSVLSPPPNIARRTELAANLKTDCVQAAEYLLSRLNVYGIFVVEGKGFISTANGQLQPISENHARCLLKNDFQEFLSRRPGMATSPRLTAILLRTALEMVRTHPFFSVKIEQTQQL